MHTVIILFFVQWTPLMKACRNGHPGVARILIEHNADVSNKDDKGRNALDIAIDEGNK